MDIHSLKRICRNPAIVAAESWLSKSSARRAIAVKVVRSLQLDKAFSVRPAAQPDHPRGGVPHSAERELDAEAGKTTINGAANKLMQAKAVLKRL